MQPEVSIIMPCYNAAPHLGPAIESVLQQHFPAWELLIVDDGSTDATPAMARAYAAEDPRIRFLSNEGGKGAAGARNTGLDQVRGKAVAFLDSDDALFPGALAALYRPLVTGNHPVVEGYAVLFCEQRLLAFLSSRRKHDAVEERPVPIPTAGFWRHMYAAEFLKRHDIRFPENLPIGEDSVFLCRVYGLLKTLPVVGLNVLLYRINHKRNIPTPTKALAFVKRFLLAREIFAGHGKEEWIVPHIGEAFFREWLQHLHAAKATGQDHAYLELCADLLRGLENEFEPVLRKQLGPLHEAFYSLWATGDYETVLALLEKHGLITPASPYMGISMRPEGLRWHWYRWSSRAANMACSADTRKTVRYFAELRRRSERRLRGRV